MKFTFIGTGAGSPSKNRRCSCTLIEAGGMYYFVDIGTDAVPDMIDMEIPMSKVKGVFVTHPHADHSNGLVSYVSYISNYARDANPEILIPNNDMANAISAWNKSLNEHFRGDIRYGLTHPGVIYDDGNMKVKAFKINHCPDAYAFSLESEGKRVLFTGDLGYLDIDYADIIAEGKFDLIVIEATHYDIDVVEELLSGFDVERVVYNHVNPKLDGMLEDTLKKEHTYEVTVSFDGMQYVM